MGNVSQLKPATSHHPARDSAAAAVRAFIGHAGVSKSAVARGIGMSQSTFSRRTNGQEPFDMDELGTIADYFGVTVIDLLSGNLTAAENTKKPPMSGGERVNVQPWDYKAEHSAEILFFPTREKDTLLEESTIELCGSGS